MDPVMDKLTITLIYRKVVSSNTFQLEVHASIFRLLVKGIFDPFPFDKKLISKLVKCIRTNGPT